MPANASFLDFLIRSTRPAVVGFNIAFCAALSLGLIEFPALLWKASWSSLPAAISMVILAAAFYALAFNALFFLTRIAAALVSHLDRFWPALVPGLVVFLLIGEPSTRYVLRYLAPGTVVTFLMAGLFVLLSIMLCLLILYFFPALRNINSSMMIGAAAAARVIALPLEHATASQAWPVFLLFEAMLLLLAAAFYGILQIRFLQHLAPLHDSPRVPLIARRVIAVLIVPAGLTLFYVVALRDDIAVGPRFAMYMAGACGFLFAVHWSLTAYKLDQMLRIRDPLPALRNPRGHYLFLGAVLSASLAAGFAAYAFPDARAARDISARGVSGREALTFLGFVFDHDKDGNSRWPGGDPDDRDPCVRLDAREHCVRSEAPSPPASARGNRRTRDSHSRIILTLAGGNFSPRTIRSVITPIATESSQLFLPAREPGRALRAIFQDLNGLQERKGMIRRSIFSHYANEGVRTVCGGYDGGRGYLSTKDSAQLHQGCQVHVPVAEARGTRVKPADTAAHMVKQMHRYREKYNLIWIHHEYRALRKNHTRSGDARELRALLEKLPEGVPVILILMGAGNRAYANAYVLGAKPSKTETPNVASLRDLINRTGGEHFHLAGLNTRRLGAGDSRRPAWISAFARALGDDRSYYTFAPRGDGIRSFHGLTGASW